MHIVELQTSLDGDPSSGCKVPGKTTESSPRICLYTLIRSRQSLSELRNLCQDSARRVSLDTTCLSTHIPSTDVVKAYTLGLVTGVKGYHGGGDEQGVHHNELIAGQYSERAGPFLKVHWPCEGLVPNTSM